MEIRVGLAFATSGHCSWRLLSKTATDCGPSSSKKLLLHTTAEEEANNNQQDDRCFVG